MQDTIVIPANGQRTERISGRFFTVLSATAKFVVELDGRNRREVRAGSKVSGGNFKRISFIETEGVENTIVFDAGDERFEGDIQVSGLSDETFDYPFLDSTGISTISGSNYTDLPLAVTLNGVSYTRKSFHITNQNSDGDLGIYTSAGKLLDVLNKNQDRLFTFNQDVKIKGVANNCSIALYYTFYKTTPES